MTHTTKTHPAFLRSRSRSLRCLFPGILILLIFLPAKSFGQQPTHYLPELQKSEATFLARHATDGLAGQEGFGDSLVVVQNLSSSAGNVDFEIVDKREGTAIFSDSRAVSAKGTARIDLAALSGMDLGFYGMRLNADQPVGVMARSHWVSGASTAYGEPEAKKGIIIPLFVAESGGLTSIYAVQNTFDDDNELTTRIFDNSAGSILLEFPAELDPNEVATWDTVFQQNLFGERLPKDAAGGFVGSLRINADENVAVMSYLDLLDADASSALVGRPANTADTVQYLPIVRKNSDGDTLIGIANPSNQDIDLTLRYKPLGSGEAEVQNLSLAKRGTVVLDLSTTGRGNVSRPGMGSFIGGLTIEASAPVLAAAIEERKEGGQIVGAAAYNAFGSNHLGTELAVPDANKAWGYRSTALYAYNAGSADANIQVEAFDESGHGAGSFNAQIGGQSYGKIDLAEQAGLESGSYRLSVNSDQPLAVVAYDDWDESEPSKIPPVEIPVQPVGSDFSGRATLTQMDDKLEVVVELRSDSGTGSARLGIHSGGGACGFVPGPVFKELNNPRDGQSVTELDDVRLMSLLTGAYEIRVHEEDPMVGRLEKACALIPQDPGAAGVDVDIVEAFVVSSGEPPPSATPTEPMPTETPTDPAPDTPTPTPVGPGPTPTDGGGDDVMVYMPYGVKNWARE